MTRWRVAELPSPERKHHQPRGGVSIQEKHLGQSTYLRLEQGTYTYIHTQRIWLLCWICKIFLLVCVLFFHSLNCVFHGQTFLILKSNISGFCFAFFFFAPDPAHVYFSFLFYFLLLIELLFLLWLPHFIHLHHLPGGWGERGRTWSFFFLSQFQQRSFLGRSGQVRGP